MTKERFNELCRDWFELPWQSTDDVRPDLSKVKVYDSTLREGLDEGVSVYPHRPAWHEQILPLASRLEALNLGAVELPGPDFLPHERLEELYGCFENTPKSVKIQFSSRDPESAKASIDEAISLGADILTNDDAGSSDLFIREPKDFERLADSLAEVVAHGKAGGVRFHATTSDSFRAPVARLATLCRRMADAGADVFGLKDTFGLATPTQAKRTVEALGRECPSIPLEIHCHDDTGLGLANTLAGAEAGVMWLDGCMNGLGDRAGHTSLEQLVMVLELSYGVRTGVPLERLREASLYLQSITGLANPTKPLVGEKIFNEARGRHLIHSILLKLVMSGKYNDDRLLATVCEAAELLAAVNERTIDEVWIGQWLEELEGAAV
ncbi:MAG: hypothetical protein WD273_03055 [Trueperaceae bacterium]